MVFVGNIEVVDVYKRVESYYYGKTEALVKCGMAEAELEYGYSHLADHEMSYQTARYNLFKFLIENGAVEDEMVRDYNFLVGENWLAYLESVYKMNVTLIKNGWFNRRYTHHADFRQ